MTASREPITIRLDQMNDAVEAVPYLLGFTPTDSLVVVALRSPRDRMFFTMRLDLMEPKLDGGVAEMVAARMAYAEAEAVMLFVYPKRRPSMGKALPRRALVDAIEQKLDVPLRDAVLVTRDRVWSYLCDDALCCPPEGRKRPTESAGQLALEAAHALNGRAVLPSRDDVVASVQPLTGSAAARMEGALETAAVVHAANPRQFRRQARRAAAEARDRYLDGPGGLSDDDAALLIVAMHEWQLRDEMLGWAVEHEDAMRSLFNDLAQRAIPPIDAPSCTAAAFLAYVQGDGLVAATALERALESDPKYSLANLLHNALDGQLPPSGIRNALSAFATKR